MNHLWGWVNEFAERFKVDAGQRREQAWPLLREQLVDVKAALDSGDRAAIAEQLAGLAYDSYSIGAAFDIRMDQAVRAVHASNMTRMGLAGEPLKSLTTGKILKGPAFRPPDMTEALRPIARLPR